MKIRNIRSILICLFLGLEICVILYGLSHTQEIFNYQNIIGLIAPRLFLFQIVLIFCILTLAFLRIGLKNFPNISIFSLLVLLIITETGLLLRFQQPLQHVHFFDEDLYLNEAQRINDSGTSNPCAFGVFERGELICFQIEDAIKDAQKAYPVLLAITFRYFGSYETVAFYLNILFGILTIVLSFLITRSLWSENAGLFSAMLLALFPFHIQWSVSASPEVPAIFFILLGVLFFIYFSKYKRHYLLTLSFLLISLAAFIRDGEPLLLLLSFLGILIGTGKEILNFVRKSWLSTLQVITIAFFLGANVLAIISSLPTHNKLHQNTIFSLEYFIKGFQSIINFHIVAHDYFILLVIIGATIGFYRLAKVSPRMAFLFGFSILSLFLLYTSLTHHQYPQGSRFVMVYVTLLIVVAGIGFDAIWNKIIPKFKVLGPLLMLSILFLYIYTNIDKLVTPRDMDLNAEEQAKIKVQAENPSCLYVTPLAAQDLFHGYNAMDYSEFESRFKGRDPVLIKQPCIIFFESLLCEQGDRKICQSILSSYKWTKLSTEGIHAWRLNQESQ